jgi:hypothetical protein
MELQSCVESFELKYHVSFLDKALVEVCQSISESSRLKLDPNGVNKSLLTSQATTYPILTGYTRFQHRLDEARVESHEGKA